MKTITFYRRNEKAFTLIELLVVIAIIGLLAGLVVAIGGPALRNARLKRASVELKSLETIIEEYKQKKGFYPPDNPKSSDTNQLFYELSGTIYRPGATPPDSATFQTVSGIGGVLDKNTLNTWFNTDGFVNSTQDQNENPVFSQSFSPGQYAEVSSSPNKIVELLVCPVPGPNMVKNLNTGAELNPWNYNSSNPTNNPNSFDLWVDVSIGNKTNRICNWSTTPIVL